MSKRGEKLEIYINDKFHSLNRKGKISIFYLLIGSLALTFILAIIGIVLVVSLSNQKNEYNSNIETATRQYYSLNTENVNLQRKLQDLDLKLSETLNNTVELDYMLKHLDKENVTLFTIKDELSTGIKRTLEQLQRMQKSMNTIISTKQTDLKSTEHNILLENQKIKE